MPGPRFSGGPNSVEHSSIELDSTTLQPSLVPPVFSNTAANMDSPEFVLWPLAYFPGPSASNMGYLSTEPMLLHQTTLAQSLHPSAVLPHNLQPQLISTTATNNDVGFDGPLINILPNSNHLTRSQMAERAFDPEQEEDDNEELDIEGQTNPLHYSTGWLMGLFDPLKVVHNAKQLVLHQFFFSAASRSRVLLIARLMNTLANQQALDEQGLTILGLLRDSVFKNIIGCSLQYPISGETRRQARVSLSNIHELVGIQLQPPPQLDDQPSHNCNSSILSRLSAPSSSSFVRYYLDPSLDLRHFAAADIILVRHSLVSRTLRDQFILVLAYMNGLREDARIQASGDLRGQGFKTRTVPGRRPEKKLAQIEQPLVGSSSATLQSTSGSPSYNILDLDLLELPLLPLADVPLLLDTSPYVIGATPFVQPASAGLLARPNMLFHNPSQRRSTLHLEEDDSEQSDVEGVKSIIYATPHLNDIVDNSSFNLFYRTKLEGDLRRIRILPGQSKDPALMIIRIVVQECWRCVYIYFYMALCGAHAEDPRVQHSLKRYMRLVNGIRPGRNPDVFLFTPMVIAGVSAIKAKHRHTLTSRTLGLPEHSKPGTTGNDLGQNNAHLARHNHVSRQISRASNRSINSPIDLLASLLSFALSVFMLTKRAQAQRRLATNGPNALSPPPSNTFRKVLEWIFGGFGSLLLAASIVCFIAWKPLGEPNPAPANLALAVVLLIVLLLNAVFNMWQGRTLASLTSLLPSAVTVLRDGQPTVTQASQLVTGDIVMLGTAKALWSTVVLTGESEPIPASTHYTDQNFLETRNIALQGTYCVSGSGMGVVVQVGDGTWSYRTAVYWSNANGKNGLTAGLTTLQLILWAAWLRRDYPNYINVPTLLIDVVSVMVAFIPEGLPVAITMSLAKVAHTLSKKKVLCKSLSIVETLGSVNVLCSDKTGTLTQNKMTVQDVAIFDTEYSVLGFRDASNEGQGNNNLRQMSAVAPYATRQTSLPN
ncbi:sodium/potassium-transporting ATPase subunit alpha [Rhizoctonia solani]|uniref:Sodium/potassium-transporting ATPase subunit alpha n=1 Tax=Rhizoctonia solani TaxID=456999 RepID=A0A8H8SXZ4_9AGAM|nr:sodium/potassium-transporting ATPase subunit alpha [Rhizoctonia solani]QRW20818.1 sodium/potassium-transporting ATPase subunit alpha [Rhizoctonia solani]